MSVVVIAESFGKFEISAGGTQGLAVFVLLLVAMDAYEVFAKDS